MVKSVKVGLEEKKIEYEALLDSLQKLVSQIALIMVDVLDGLCESLSQKGMKKLTIKRLMMWR